LNNGEILEGIFQQDESMSFVEIFLMLFCYKYGIFRYIFDRISDKDFDGFDRSNLGQSQGNNSQSFDRRIYMRFVKEFLGNGHGELNASRNLSAKNGGCANTNSSNSDGASANNNNVNSANGVANSVNSDFVNDLLGNLDKNSLLKDISSVNGGSPVGNSGSNSGSNSGGDVDELNAELSAKAQLEKRLNEFAREFLK
jgi:hypothetical protein